MIGKTILPELRSLIDARDFATLREILDDLLPPELAELINDFPGEDRAVIFRLLPTRISAETFAFLEPETQVELIRGLGKEEVGRVLNEMSPDDRTAFLEELPSTVARELITLLTPEERRQAQLLLGYPEDSVGRLMTPDYLSVRKDWKVSGVLEFIRQYGKDSETLNVIYVTDERGILLDDLHIRELLLASPESSVESLIDGRYISLSVTDTREQAVQMFTRYNRFALPVVGSDGLLIGIVTGDDVLNVAEEENTEDMQKFGGQEALETPYIATPLFRAVRARAGWLTVLFIGEMLTATAMAFFEDEISRAVVLALFVPMIISSGGNSGSQAATLIIRAMALGEITLPDWWRVMRREVISGFLLGFVLGVIGFLRIVLWSMFTSVYGDHWLRVAVTVSISLVGVVMWGTLSGSMLPFLLKRLGADPATSSAPFVATLVDVTGILIYFTAAYFILFGGPA
jgi:magnesium transporter